MDWQQEVRVGIVTSLVTAQHADRDYVLASASTPPARKLRHRLYVTPPRTSTDIRPSPVRKKSRETPENADKYLLAVSASSPVS